MLQRFVALKVVIANCLVQHHLKRGRQRLRTVKTAIGLISKKATLHVKHTFLYISLLLFCATTTWNFQKHFMHVWRKCCTCSRSLFFSIAAHFVLELVAASISLFTSPPQQKLYAVLSTKKCLLCFLSLALDLCRPFSRWVSLAFRLLSLTRRGWLWDFPPK